MLMVTPGVLEYNLNLYSGLMGSFFIDTCFVKYVASTEPNPTRLFLEN